MVVLQGEEVAVAVALRLVVRRALIVGIISVSSLLTLGCSGDEASFCDTAREFQTSVRQLDASELATALGPEFWDGIDQMLADLAASEPELVGPVANDLRNELALLVERLEAYDYNVITTALDPEAAERFFMVTAAAVAFAADELQSQVDANC